MKTDEIVIPEISDEELSKRMERIGFVTQAMSGLDGRPHSTQETDKNLFDLFYVESSAHPRTESFNLDGGAKMGEKATNLTELLTKDIFITVGGYYGFLKMTMAEVLSQIPEEILDNVVAFALNPEKDADVIDGGNYHLVSIIFYGKTDIVVQQELPSSKGLMSPVDYEKANRLKSKVSPMIKYSGEERIFSLDPANIDEPFMKLGIWLRVNGSNLHRVNTSTKVDVPYVAGKEVSVYQPFTHGADFFAPTYAYVISQIPDELINENTIGLLYGSTGYFKTKEGVIHKTNYLLIEKK